MAGLLRRVNAGLSCIFPERRIFVQTGRSTSYVRVTPASQFVLATAGLAALAWLALATSIVVLDRVAARDDAVRSVVLRSAYETRLEELSAERDQRAAEARSAQERFRVAMDQISRQQTRILESVEERRELATALDLMRERLREAVAEREAVEEANATLVAEMSDAAASLSRNRDADLAETLTAISGALAEAAADRDAANAERDRLTHQLAELELEIMVNSRRQDDMVEQLEQAVAMTFGPLEQMFERTDIDVDAVLAAVRSTHSGQGGGEDGVSVSSRSVEGDGYGARFATVMNDLDRLGIMRVAAGKIPYAMPVLSSHRFTSGFGHRRDPLRGGRRMHNGLDFAAPRGTPIHAAADGVVIDAQRESGYGNVVRIRHEFGFETVYAHMHRLHVSEGEKVSRGDRIGDMGSTGRSTGVHLHYEVHLNGRPVNPMTYLEAARNVF